MAESWTVLIVEPERRLNKIIESAFVSQGIQTLTTFETSSALEAIAKKNIDLIVMEGHFTGEEDFSLLVKIRQFTLIPIIIVSSLTHESQRIQGFELGADDYLSKPFNQQELWLRSQRLLKYFYDPSPFKKIGQHYVYPFMTFDLGRRLLVINRKEVSLTPREFDLLQYFVERPEEVISRQELLKEVWGYEYFGEERTVDVHIRKLRKKLGKYSDVAAHSLLTEWQRGYRFTTQPQKP